MNYEPWDLDLKKRKGERHGIVIKIILKRVRIHVLWRSFLEPTLCCRLVDSPSPNSSPDDVSKKGRPAPSTCDDYRFE